LLERKKMIKVHVSYPVQKYLGKYTQKAGVTLREPLKLLGESLFSKRSAPGGEPQKLFPKTLFFHIRTRTLKFCLPHPANDSGFNF